MPSPSARRRLPAWKQRPEGGDGTGAGWRSSDRPDQPPLGAGEPTIGAMGGAIGNAVYAAVGKRLRALPFTPERVKAALDG